MADRTSIMAMTVKEIADDLDRACQTFERFATKRSAVDKALIDRLVKTGHEFTRCLIAVAWTIEERAQAADARMRRKSRRARYIPSSGDLH